MHQLALKRVYVLFWSTILTSSSQLGKDSVRLSSWNQANLSDEQIKYALVDAYASARVYEELLALEDAEKVPSRTSLVPGTSQCRNQAAYCVLVWPVHLFSCTGESIELTFNFGKGTSVRLYNRGTGGIRGSRR